MTFEELQQTLASVVEVDLAQIYAAYQQRSQRRDIDGFIDYLHEEGHIDAFLFSDLHSGGAVEVTQLIDELGQPHEPAPTTVQFADEGGDSAAASLGGEGDASSGQTESSDGPGLGQRYSLLGVLGKGAMGEVRIARDVHLRRKVALKTILPQIAQHRSFFARFLQEVQITAQLDHPNVVPVYGLEVSGDGSVAYAMKLVQGRELADVIRTARERCERREPLGDDHGTERRLEHFLRLCDAVAFAHGKGIIHRDLKPANIMVGRYNEVYLMDWGIARLIGSGEVAEESGVELVEPDADPTNVERTRVGTALGTPCYMSPEQAAGRNDELDGQSDQYTLGLILQEVVTLKRALRGKTVQEVVSKAKNAEKHPAKPEIAGTSVPRELRAIISKATRREPRERYGSVVDLAEDLRRYLRGDEIVAEPDNLLRKAGRWVSKHRMASLGIMSAFVFLAVLGAVIGVMLSHEQGVRDEAHRHEARLNQFVNAAALHARLVDAELQRYEAELEHLVGAFEQVISHARPSDEEVFFAKAFTAGDQAPPDLAESPYYGREVSLRWPAFHLAPGVDRDGVLPGLRKLEWVRPALQRMMLRSHHEAPHLLSEEERDRLLRVEGVPMHRVFVSLADGTHLVYPGMGGIPEQSDARLRPSYKLAENKVGQHWGAPHYNAVGHSLVAPCSAAIFAGGVFRGVAGFEVSLAYIVERLLYPVELGYVEDAMLVDAQGQVLVHEDHLSVEANAAQLRGGDSIDLQVLPLPEVVAAIKRGGSGNLETTRGAQRLMVVYQRLHATGWYYVVIADAAKMFAAEQTRPSPRQRPSAVSQTAAAPDVTPTSSPEASASAYPNASAEASRGSAAPAAPSKAPQTGGPKTVKLKVQPPFASVIVDGTPGRASNGLLELSGAVGSVHTVQLLTGGVKVPFEVTITEQGPEPASIGGYVQPSTKKK